jgi:methyltransferase (TIGR00027 family)
MQQDTHAVDAREPSFTAMWHAWLRNAHATTHASPVFADTRSVQLVPEPTLRRIVSVQESFSPGTSDAIVLMAVVRHRLLADRVPPAHERGVRQLLILGAGLDTTGFALPSVAKEWRVFEVDHPATQEWKRRRIDALGWESPANLVFAPCDFERRDLLDALEQAGLNRKLPVLVSLFGVILYLTADATEKLLSALATFAPSSEVNISYSPPPDGTDPVVDETFKRATPVVDSTGESFVGYYRELEIENLVQAAGFHDAIHHRNHELNARYFAARSDGLRLHTIEQLVTAVC